MIDILLFVATYSVVKYLIHWESITLKEGILARTVLTTKSSMNNLLGFLTHKYVAISPDS